MPSYDFECRDCGQRFTTRIALRDKDKAACPGCAGRSLKQLFTGLSFITPGGSSSSSSCGSGSGNSGVSFG